MKNKILISVLIALLIIGFVVLLKHYSSVRRLLLVEKELEKEIEELKAKGIPTTVEELNLPQIPDAENGALVYKEIFELKDSLNEKYKELFDYSPHQGTLIKWEEVPEEKKEKVIDFVLNNPDFAAMYQLLEKASNMECRFSNNEDYQKLYSYDSKVGNYLRSCARDLTEKAKIEREYGSIDRSLQASLVGLKIAKSLANEPTVIDQLIRFALDGIALYELEETLKKEGGSLKLYQALIDEIEKERKTNIINLALKRELIWHILSYFSNYKKMGAKAFELTKEEKKIEKSHGRDYIKQIKDQKQALKKFYLNSGCKTPKEFFEKQEIYFLRIMSKVIPLTEKPYWQADKEFEEIEKDSKNLLYEDFVAPPNKRMYTVEAQCDARLGIAEIAIANKIYKTKHEEYVESLTQLSPEILPSLPLDPFTGKDYIYKKKDKGFIVYSVGENLKDDNGTKRSFEKGSPAYENYDIVWELDN